MKLLLTVAVLLVMFVLLLRASENRFVFFPAKYPDGFWHPDAFGLQVEDCFFESQDGVRLHGWFVKHENPQATLLWCHGNAGNLSHRVDNLIKLAQLPINIFIFDYRGYGKSEGKPDEPGIYRDALAAYDYLVSRPDVDAESLVIFGRSLGGAVAVELATQRPCAGLILESTFTSARDMARSAFGFLPVHLVMKTQLNSVDKIGDLDVPLLFVHGTADRVVPLRLGEKLFAVANSPKDFYKIPDADHNDTYIVGGDAYFERLGQFISSAVLHKPAR